MTYARIILTFLVAFTALPAFAGTACYAPTQMQAEQLLRLHSELMVITTMCRQGAHGEDLVAAYSDFTKKNITALHNAEQVMIAYYQNTGRGNALDQLDRLRTLLGNEYGQKAADMSAPAFCGVYRDKVTRFDAATTADLAQEVQQMQHSEHFYAKPCASGATVVAKKGN